MNFEIPECAKYLPFSENIIFYPDNYEFENPDTIENDIPKIIHLIWVGNEPPSYFELYLKKWKELMPDWEVRYWSNKDITVEHFPQSIIDKINLCEKGAQKADIMRYFIIEKYGGFYVDSDVTPHRSFEPLLKIDAKAIICHDLPLTWKYIINAFFGGVPHHTLFQNACSLCYNIVINTEDIHMQSGPRLFGEAVSKVSNKIVLLPTKFFYRNENYDGRFGNHFYAKCW
uniref:Glycosyltransferase n=1 Tax=viral metagenome TaxID=1070528 RepID=A0A6C0HSK9_9ZZZZ